MGADKYQNQIENNKQIGTRIKGSGFRDSKKDERSSFCVSNPEPSYKTSFI